MPGLMDIPRPALDNQHRPQRPLRSFLFLSYVLSVDSIANTASVKSHYVSNHDVQSPWPSVAHTSPDSTIHMTIRLMADIILRPGRSCFSIRRTN